MESKFTFFEIINPSGSGKDTIQQKWISFNQLHGSNGQGPSITKGYDRIVKGNIYAMESKTSKASIEFINPMKATSGNIHNCLVIQLCSWDELPLSLEMTVIDDKMNRKRIYISTSFHSFESNELHAKIPWQQPNRTKWTNLLFALEPMTSTCFHGSLFHRLESFQLKPCCRIRKVFLISSEMLQLDKTYSSSNVKIPASLNFAPSVGFQNYTFMFDHHESRPSIPTTDPKRKLSTTSAATTTDVKSKLQENSTDIMKDLQKQFLVIEGIAKQQPSVISNSLSTKENLSKDLKLLRKRQQMKSRELLPSDNTPKLPTDTEQQLLADIMSMNHSLLPLPIPQAPSSTRSSSSKLMFAGQQSVTKDDQIHREHSISSSSSSHSLEQHQKSIKTDKLNYLPMSDSLQSLSQKSLSIIDEVRDSNITGSHSNRNSRSIYELPPHPPNTMERPSEWKVESNLSELLQLQVDSFEERPMVFDDDNNSDKSANSQRNIVDQVDENDIKYFDVESYHFDNNEYFKNRMEEYELLIVELSENDKALETIPGIHLLLDTLVSLEIDYINEYGLDEYELQLADDDNVINDMI